MESCNRRDEVKSREEVGRKKERRLCQRREKQRITERDKEEREREDYVRGYHQWQPRRSPRKSKLFEVDRGKTLIVLVCINVSSEFALSIFVMLYILFIVNI